jgi:hypothetical protein
MDLKSEHRIKAFDDLVVVQQVSFGSNRHNR